MRVAYTDTANTGRFKQLLVGQWLTVNGVEVRVYSSGSVPLDPTVGQTPPLPPPSFLDNDTHLQRCTCGLAHKEYSFITSICPPDMARAKRFRGRPDGPVYGQLRALKWCTLAARLIHLSVSHSFRPSYRMHIISSGQIGVLGSAFGS